MSSKSMEAKECGGKVAIMCVLCRHKKKKNAMPTKKDVFLDVFLISNQTDCLHVAHCNSVESTPSA